MNTTTTHTAAPELLETLKKVHALYYAADINGGTKAAFKAALYEAARLSAAAIAKAEGGAK